ncbi:Zn-dependent hydrolase [Haloarcula laminariae]|uniref:Zn-dependent hydrolase n=1 Tax=Haloarcula laminariae TaxID=2961577 RepID=UPI0021C69B08
MSIQIDRERLIETMETQADIGGTEDGGLHRLALSDADKAVRDWFLEAMEDAGLETRVDRMGNMFGRRSGTDSSADPVLLGSHLDSQPFGGIYDGALGVVAALECIRTFNDEGIETSHPIEIVNWTNEEGSRFQPAMQGSGVWTGELDLETEYNKTDAEGVRFEDELERIGYKGDVPAEPTTEYDSSLELHIEQGPKLENNEKDLGVVTGVVGLTWGAVTFYGAAEHTGTTPMHDRQDALVAAADFITAVRRLGGTLGKETVASVGRADVSPNSINIVPEEVTVTWGIRDPSDDVVEEGRERVLEEAAAIADREGVNYEWEDRARSSSIRFPERPVTAIGDAAQALGYDSLDVFSGAVHDAAKVGTVCDTAMVFSVSEDGKSHTEEEYTSWDDCYSAANTLANAVLNLAE